MVKAWQDGQGEPGWLVSLTDSTLSAAGSYGLGASVGSATAIQVDHFTANTIPTPGVGVPTIFYSGSRDRRVALI